MSRTPYPHGQYFVGEPVDMAKVNELKNLDDAHVKKYPHQEIKLRTNVKKESFVQGQKVASFYIEADYVEIYESRAEEQPVRRTAAMMVRFEKTDDGMDVFCFGDPGESGVVMKELKKALGLKPRHFTHLELKKEDLKAIALVDCEIWERGNWKDVDVDTKGASLRGRLDKSVYTAQFEKKGTITSIGFASKYLGSREVSISSIGTVGIKGRDATQVMVSDYFQKVVRPNLTP